MKRYVLLEDKRIIDTSKNGFWRKEVIEESDNLLDLLEVGDCVEDKRIGIAEVDDIKHEIDYYAIFPHNLSAIWKRSGDIMRRYEV